MEGGSGVDKVASIFYSGECKTRERTLQRITL